jgi:ribosomal protein S18 acetylase RimI-like enzyme
MKYQVLDEKLIKRHIDELLFIIKDEIDEYWTIDNFLYPLPNKFDYSLVAIEDNKVQAFIVASLKGPVVHIHKFMTHPKLRGKGIGTKVLEEFITSISKYCKGITLKVYGENVLAQNFYLKNKFHFGRKSGQIFEMFRSLTSTVVSIHQPNFMPWLGYFSKIKKADFFVLLDNVQYTKNSYINRVQLPVGKEASWLTIPVQKPELSTQIRDIEIAVGLFKVKKQVKRIAQSYAKAPFFKEVFPVIEKLLMNESSRLSEFNANLIRGLCLELGIKTVIVTASALEENKDVEATTRLISICTKFKANTYLSGKGGFDYQDGKQFDTNGIEVKPVGFLPYEYERFDGNEFISGMSIIDALFQEGFSATFEKL